MASQKSAVALTGFFSSLFHNFPRLLLTNLLFAPALALSLGLFVFINNLTGLHSMFILFLAVIPAFPFYAGVTQVTSHMVRGESGVHVLENFIGGVKENFLRFTVHGAALYVAVLICYYSITLYLNLASKDGVFYIMFAVCVLIAVFFLFAFFYIPPMTVTFDIKMKDIFRNSALMAFGELKHNLIAVIGLAILFLFCATLLICSFTPILLTIITVFLGFFVVPSVVSFIINSAVYKNMYAMIADKGSKRDEINKKIEDKRKKRSGGFEKEDDADEYSALSDIEINESADGDEFIFYNGKMIKRSHLIKLKKEALDKQSKIKEDTP